MKSTVSLSQVVRPGATLHMQEGDRINLILPSGKEVTVVVIADERAIVRVDSSIVYSENHD